MSPFSDPDSVASYADRPARQVPGFHALQRMAGLLLAERVADDGRVLVLGAGGGLELKVFAEMQPGWRFDGVDPSGPMLDLARATLGPLAERVRLHESYIDDAPEGPFDGAACLLTLHFIPEEERLRTLVEVRRRLKPGAPFVAAHHSIPADAKTRWLARYAAFAAADVASTVETMSERLPSLSPERDEALLREAGFTDVELFYAAFTFRGWVATA